MTRVVLIVLIFGLAGIGPVAAQQDISNLLNRLARLEREIADLQRSVYTGQPGTVAEGQAATVSPPAGPGASPLARVEVRLQQIEAELRAVTGRVEELAFGLERVTDRVDRLQADTDLRFQELTGPVMPGTGPAASTAGPVQPGLQGDPTVSSLVPTDAPPTDSLVVGAVPPPVPAASSDETPTFGAPPSTLGTLTGSDLATLGAAPAPAEPTQPDPAVQALLPEGSVEDRYKAAFDHLVKHDLDQAERAFTQFLEAHPDDPLAGNAQYWLGETYYARERHEEAAVAFLEGYQRYPESPKAADNLLKLGMSLARIGRTQEACTTFAKLSEDFPNAPTNIKRRLTNEVRTYQCGGG